MSVSAASRSIAAGDRTVPGDAMLHPLVLAGVAALVLNDRLLKSVAPGPVTGKLSDVAGLVFFPILLVSAWEVSRAARGRWAGPTAGSATIAVVATGLVFSAAKTSGVGEWAYEVGLGALQWPFAAFAELLAGGAPTGPRRVELVADPTDLVALAALAVPWEIGRRRAAGVGAVPARLRPYDLTVALLSLALLAGATLDGWAHSHDRLALEAILTPWHAVVYAAFLGVAGVLLGPPLLARLDGRDARAAIPSGYGWSLVGLVAFLGAGLADAGWHVAFGIEADAEALLSPTHLALGISAGLIASGPLRRAWMSGDDATWPAFLAPLLAMVAIAGLAGFALHVANLFVDPWPRFTYERFDVTWYGPNVGVASAVVGAVVLVVPTLFLARRWPTLPFGTMTLLVAGGTAGLTFLHDESVLVGAPFLGGFLADVALLAARRLDARRRVLAIGAIVPACVFAAYFLVLDATGPVAWSAHLIGGSVLIGATTGLALAALTLLGPPRQSSG